MIIVAAVTVALSLFIGGVAYLTYGGIAGMKHEKEGPATKGVQFNVEMLSDTSGLEPNQTTDLVFAVLDVSGNALKDYRISHEKLMHLIIVRKDLQWFQHLHPQHDSQTGRFSVP